MEGISKRSESTNTQQVLIQSGDYSSKKCIKLCMLCKTKQKCVIFCFKMFVAQLVIARSKKALKSVSFA